MARIATGNAFESNGRFYARITISKKRVAFPLPLATDLENAKARAAILNTYARALEKAGKLDSIDRVIREAAAATDAEIATFDLLVSGMTSGRVVPVAPTPKGPTFQSLAEDWTSGKLNERWPDVVKLKRSKANDAGRLTKWIYPHVGAVELTSFTMDHAEEVMRKLPAKVSSSTRRHVAQLIRRVMQLAEYPVRAIAHSPIRKGFVPSAKRSNHLAYLYRDEDAALLSCVEVPFNRRLLWGFLAREGLRISEAVGAPATDDQPEQEPLRWRDFDLTRGTVTILDYKTRERRSWVLAPTVATVLAEVKKARKADDSAAVFLVGTTNNLPKKLRRDMVTAKVNRSDLHTTVKLGGVTVSRRMRVHDLRATFITHAFAEGRSEAFIMDRTGHDTSADVNRYRRPARTLTELGADAVGLLPLADLLVLPQSAGGNGRTGDPGGEETDPNLLILAGSGEGNRTPIRGIKISHIGSNTQETGAKSQSKTVVEVVSHPIPAASPAAIVDPIEAALAGALEAATGAGQWAVVAQLATELEARRLARANVVDLSTIRRGRGGVTR